MSVNPEDWDVDFAFPDFNLVVCLNENEADVDASGPSVIWPTCCGVI